MKKYFSYIFKIIALLITIIIAIYFSMVAYNEISRCLGETIILSDNYKGFVYIFYDEKNGLFEKENGKMLYKIPSSGVYKTSSKYSKRLYTHEHSINFYYIDSLNNRKLIPNYLFGRDLPKLDSNSIVSIFKNIPNHVYSDTSIEKSNNKFFWGGPLMVYQIDSLKNFKREAPPLSKIKYENSKNK